MSIATAHAGPPQAGRSPLVIKFGGELIDDAGRLRVVVAAMAAARGDVPLVIVHGGGKEIDAALKVAGIPKEQVDGLRITSAATLDVVVAVLAGSVNTRLVGSLTAAGVPAVGLTGADGRCGRAEPAPPHRAVDGRIVDLGRVGVPRRDADVRVLRTLLAAGFVPVIASIGVEDDGSLLNVNADTFAVHLAVQLQAERLVVAGTTAGVLDGQGATVPELDPAAVERMIGSKTATAGMIAKLRACEEALAGGVGDVMIVDGRDGDALAAVAAGRQTSRVTRLVSAIAARP